MFLHALQETNRPLVEAAFRLHQSGEVGPDSYLLDLDTLEANARAIKAAGDQAGLALYFMTKQLGRNPEVCRRLTALGYPGAVVVDWREAERMMEHGIPIAHAGHLVQIPDAKLPALLRYGVGMITVFSLEKARRISEIATQLGIVQRLCVRAVGPGDFVYPGQEGGFAPGELPGVLRALDALGGVRVDCVTAFPCFLYGEDTRRVDTCPNAHTVLAAAATAREVLGREVEVNLPSCTQVGLMQQIAGMGGNSAEPGSALIGTLPNNTDGGTAERLALVYLSEVSHNSGGVGRVYGGGIYPRGHAQHALVGRSAATAQGMELLPRPADNIDYYIGLTQPATVGDTAVLCFRPQIFTSRSHVVLVEGAGAGTPRVVGRYDAQGRAL